MDKGKIEREKSAIEKALRDGLSKKHIRRVKIEIDRNNILGSYHLFVISPQFKNKAQMDRDELVWEVIRALPFSLAMKISMVFAITEDELEDVKAALNSYA